MGLAPLGGIENLNESIKTELTILQKAVPLDRGKPTLPPIKHAPASHTMPEQPVPIHMPVAGAGLQEATPGSSPFLGAREVVGGGGIGTDRGTVSRGVAGGVGGAGAGIGVGIADSQSEALKMQKKRAAAAAAAAAAASSTQENSSTNEGGDKRLLGGFFGLFGGVTSTHNSNGIKTKAEDSSRSTRREGDRSQLPEGWAEATTKDGRTYYVDHIAKLTTWTDPRTLTTNAKFRAKDQNGNIQEVVFQSHSRRSVSSPEFVNQTPGLPQPTSSFFEDPRKKAEERMKQRIRDMKG